MFQKLAAFLYFVSDRVLASLFIGTLDVLYAIWKGRQYVLGFMIFGIVMTLVYMDVGAAFIVAALPLIFLLISWLAMIVIVFLGLFFASLGDYCRRLA